jgi:hypothetical protein
VIDDTRLFYDLTAERTAKEWYEKDVVMPTTAIPVIWLFALT